MVGINPGSVGIYPGDESPYSGFNFFLTGPNILSKDFKLHASGLCLGFHPSMVCFHPFLVFNLIFNFGPDGYHTFKIHCSYLSRGFIPDGAQFSTFSDPIQLINQSNPTSDTSCHMNECD
jgi:hypothetical protein